MNSKSRMQSQAASSPIGLTPSQILHFRNHFELERKKLLDSQKAAREVLSLSRDDMADEADLTASQMVQSLTLRLKGRERNYLEKVEQALERIRSGCFGTCEDCGESIEFKRIEIRPTVEFCISCKEEKEHQKRAFV